MASSYKLLFRFHVADFPRLLYIFLDASWKFSFSQIFYCPNLGRSMPSISQALLNASPILLHHSSYQASAEGLLVLHMVKPMMKARDCGTSRETQASLPASFCQLILLPSLFSYQALTNLEFTKCIKMHFITFFPTTLLCQQRQYEKTHGGELNLETIWRSTKWPQERGSRKLSVEPVRPKKGGRDCAGAWITVFS